MRRSRLPRTGPAFHVAVAETYDSRTISADAATCCHHTAASPPVYGRVATSSTGCAPSAARSWTNESAFCRYCALLSDHGVTRFAPDSSLRTITGVAQPVCATANVNRLCAFADISDGSTGFVVVPIRLLKLRSK